MKQGWAVAVAIAAGCGASGGKKSAVMYKPVELPVTMVEDRYFLDTKTITGAPLRLYLDSAGGMFLTRQAVDRLKLPITHVGDDDTVEFPRFYDARVPRPMGDAFPVLGTADEAPTDGSDGMLGAPWFGGRVFTFDYGGKRLLFRAPGDLPKVPSANRIAVGLMRGDSGEAIAPYGRIQIEVDGAPIDMLFDTGATIVLTDGAKQALGGTATERATSFITESVFERWRTAHPDWRVIDDADQSVKGAPLIEVPRVRIAGHDVGPVWFTRRPDAAFHQFMAQSMDKPTEGAVGGSVLRHFQRVTVDWANAVAVFE